MTNLSKFSACCLFLSISILDSPELSCHETDHVGVLESALFVTCDLWSNPKAYITWYYQDASGTTREIETHPDYVTSFKASTEVYNALVYISSVLIQNRNMSEWCS